MKAIDNLSKKGCSGAGLKTHLLSGAFSPSDCTVRFQACAAEALFERIDLAFFYHIRKQSRSLFQT